MELQQLAQEAAARGVSPFAVFDPHMDCIRVLIRDCSFFERRANKWITLVYDNYPEADKGQSPLVGVVIKGMHYLIRKLNLAHGSVIQITELIDEISKKFPEETVAELSTLGTILKETEMGVRLPEDRLAPV